ncbi:2OG-Fe(II) oxygenase [Shewanella woodyi]|uniref:2OG-Fe(II) oxygenase n=1 Tax=Shewanella woodyi (strain ATCC 51908 / MS32) TaxID=392500 RepID=B1KQ96_SHEWM|nr:2OG-Fe(II) oxygenase [Shewanella woodyi]ACA84751.1 2OG-Fe(II) oxygenase [Shewanella woodyi ATCC 51908]
MALHTGLEIDPSMDQYTSLFESIVQDVADNGYSIKTNALPVELAQKLSARAQAISDTHFKAAGIGRSNELMLDTQIRSDEICWIVGDSELGASWLNWVEGLKQYVNRTLFLGLDEFESHFAHYSEGDFYQKHKDAFRGESNRILTLVAYLNEDWSEECGGELLVYPDDSDEVIAKVAPHFGTIVVFMSEEFPHEVLPAKCDRYSIATWFRRKSDKLS